VALLTFAVSMTASEAASLDPQLRMMLEITFECFESGIYHLLLIQEMVKLT